MYIYMHAYSSLTLISVEILFYFAVPNGLFKDIDRTRTVSVSENAGESGSILYFIT